MGWIYLFLGIAFWLAGVFVTIKIILTYDLDLFDEGLTEPDKEKDLLEWAAFWPLFWALNIGLVTYDFLHGWMSSFVQANRKKTNQEEPP